MIAAPYVADAAAPIPAQVQTPAPSAYIVSDKPYIGIQESEDIPANSPEELWSVDTNPACDGIPLEYDLAHQLVESCLEHDVPLELAIAVMEQESGFQPDAVNPVTGCYGLYQLSPRFFPSGLTPAENIKAGVGYLGGLLELYDGDQARAATGYYYGPSERTSSWYSDEVLERAEKWRSNH